MTLETLMDANVIAEKIANQESIISQLHEFTDSAYQDHVSLTTPFNSRLRYEIRDQYLKDIVAWLITKHEIILKDLRENLEIL